MFAHQCVKALAHLLRSALERPLAFEVPGRPPALPVAVLNLPPPFAAQLRFLEFTVVAAIWLSNCLRRAVRAVESRRSCWRVIASARRAASVSSGLDGWLSMAIWSLRRAFGAGASP